MNTKSPKDNESGEEDSASKDATPFKKAEDKPTKSEDKAKTAQSQSLEQQDTLLLFGDLVNRKSLEAKAKDELIKIIFDLNAELVRTTSRLGKERAAHVFDTDVEIQEYVRVPAGQDKGTSDKGRPSVVWRVVFISSKSGQKPLALEIWAPVIVGRREGDIVPQVDLTDYDAGPSGVSRWHALIRPTEAGLFLTDLRSTNGTYYNGDRLQPAVAQELKNGDSVAFGKLLFRVRITRQPAPSKKGS